LIDYYTQPRVYGHQSVFSPSNKTEDEKK